MKKKYLAFCIGDLKHLAQSINGTRLLLEKTCENFDKFITFLKQKLHTKTYAYKSFILI